MVGVQDVPGRRKRLELVPDGNGGSRLSYDNNHMIPLQVYDHIPQPLIEHINGSAGIIVTPYSRPDRYRFGFIITEAPKQPETYQIEYAINFDPKKHSADHLSKERAKVMEAHAKWEKENGLQEGQCKVSVKFTSPPPVRMQLRG